MKKIAKVGILFLLICMLCTNMGVAQASTLSDKLNRFLQATSTPTVNRYGLCFWSSDRYDAYANWKRTSGGVNIRVKMSNESDEAIDAYTINVRAQNAYGENIDIVANDDCYYDSLWYTHDKTIKTGKSAYSPYMFVKGTEKIKYIYLALVKFHYKDGATVELTESEQSELCWTIP